MNTVMSNRTEKYLGVKMQRAISKGSSLFVMMMLVMVFIIAGISFDTAEARNIWRVDKGAVVLAKADKGAVNQHPKVFGARDLYFALRALKVRKKSGVLDNLSLGVLEKARGGASGRTAPLFTDAEARILVPHLLEGFRQAKSSQDVTFSLKQSRGKIGGAILGSAGVVTSGRMFFSSGRLNIIFGAAFNDAARKTGALDRDARRFGLVGGKTFEQGPSGSRRSKSRLGVDIATGDGIALTTFDGKKRTDWVQIVSLEAIAAAAGVQDSQRGGASSRPQLSVEQRLAKLKNLRDQGLISNDVYKSQTLKVLDSSL